MTLNSILFQKLDSLKKGELNHGSSALERLEMKLFINNFEFFCVFFFEIVEDVEKEFREKVE
jgi:hypothetical protein